MSGNNHDDILNHFHESDTESVKKLIVFMGSYHPHIEIDRAFQRTLKKNLLEKAGKKTPIWYIQLSYLSILATSFLLVFGIWKMWDIDVSKNVQFRMGTISQYESEKNDRKVTKASIPMAQDIALMDDASIVPTEKQVSSVIAQNIEPNLQGNMAKSLTSKQAQPPKESIEMNLTQEIENISNDIESIVNNIEPISPQNPDDGMGMAKVSTLAALAPQEQISKYITIDYPSKMAVYKKAGAWNAEEQNTRTGSGIIKKLEKTLTKSELGDMLLSEGEISNMTLTYKIAKKPGDGNFYLIPCLGFTYKDARSGFLPLIRDYILD